MKCPKCGYLGFETTDRCRNCQYDFALAEFAKEPDLQLRDTDRLDESVADFDLPAPASRRDRQSSPGPDLDRLFGDAESVKPPAPLPPLDLTFAESPPPQGESPPASREGASALPFDDMPIPATPRAARPPLGVRRTTPEIPRNRPRTTRPIRVESALAFETETSVTSSAVTAAGSERSPGLMAPPLLGSRIGAGLVDVALLGLIDVVVIFLTLRVAGLQTTTDDIRVLLSVPFVGFFGLLTFGYVASFTVAGGQTIGKMLLKLRVVGDDGRPVDAAGGVLRAAGCMLVPLTLGASYVPALVTPDQRALHDRLAGTRVVCE